MNFSTINLHLDDPTAIRIERLYATPPTLGGDPDTIYFKALDGVTLLMSVAYAAELSGRLNAYLATFSRGQNLAAAKEVTAADIGGFQ